MRHTLQHIKGEGMAGGDVGTLGGFEIDSGKKWPHRIAPMPPTKRSALHAFPSLSVQVKSLDRDAR